MQINKNSNKWATDKSIHMTQIKLNIYKYKSSKYRIDTNISIKKIYIIYSTDINK